MNKEASMNKKMYHSPDLEEFGHVADLTLGSGSSPMMPDSGIKGDPPGPKKTK